ncbi:hypothetical protein SAMN05216516_101641 [Izhakiella capsodis]|uniref:Uncharacterized protein n=1 Tax=Izhakiella capsodis TaxID=1367852 RepID=A0A1I4VA56_9GAMM|nr:hypothetical protein SAMN05216516_101641 [Izhakiella capsodis]
MQNIKDLYYEMRTNNLRKDNTYDTDAYKGVMRTNVVYMKF